MPMRTYHEFDVLADKPKHDRSGLRGLTVRLLASPHGEPEPVRRTLGAPLARQLTERLAALETRQLDMAGVIGLGSALADLLFPTAIRALLVESLNGLGTDEGLRIRLRLDPALAEIPWEFAWFARQQGERDSTGFLVLDPRISLVRHQAVTGMAAVADDPKPRDRRVVVALANPDIPGQAPLDLAAERLNLENALAKVPRMPVDFVEDPSIQDLSDALGAGADVFHFAGHGVEDALVLVGSDGAAWRLPADQLAVNLRDRGVRLAVVGACESGERTRQDAWSGVATRLIALGIPAVVAMQYRIGDSTAIAFSATLYRSLAAGLSLDEAVSAGRLAIFNATTGGRADPDRVRLWRDWGVPVVYLLPDTAISLTSVAEPEERERIVEELALPIRVRVKDVEKGGKVIGAEAGVIRDGRIDVGVRAGDVAGIVEGLDADRIEGGTVTVDIDAGNVQSGGCVVGARIGSIGGRRPARRRKDP